MQNPESEGQEGWLIPTSPFFHPKSSFILGQRPCGVWPTDPSTAGPWGIFPISTCFGEVEGMKTLSASGML